MNPAGGTADGVTIIPLPTQRRFADGDDLAAALLDAAEAAGISLRDGDIVCVASKVVALVEGRTVALDGDPATARRALARQQAAAIVADDERVLVTRTHHGFVVANAGIDTSNVGVATALLLPDDADASAASLRDTLRERTSRRVGVVVTDTFGRPWRLGQTDVAIGIAGAPALRDERGGHDLDGTALEVTLAAVGDEIAGAADLVRAKASAAPFVLVRGIDGATPGTARDLVRPAHEDLFAHGGATAVETAVAARRTIRHFTDRAVPEHALHAAVRAAATAPAPHHTRPWRFVRLQQTTRRRLLDAMAADWHADLASDGADDATIRRRIERSDAVLRTAPELLVPFVVLDGQHHYDDERRSTAERDLFLLSGGAAIQNAQVVLAGHGLGAAWMSSTAFCAPTVRSVLQLDDSWQPLGMLAVGWPATSPPPRGPGDVTDLLIEG